MILLTVRILQPLVELANGRDKTTWSAPLSEKVGNFTNHKDNIAVAGLEDLFKWASEVVSDGEDSRVKRAREHRIRRQVLEALQLLKEQKAVKQMTEEVAYLQRRVIALLQRLQEVTEESSTVKQTLVIQCNALERIPKLEQEIERLTAIEWDMKVAREEQKELMNALSKLKIDRDFLDDLLRTSEDENARLARLLCDVRAELDKLKARRWWHIFWKPASPL